MAKLYLDYTVLDGLYENGVFRFFQGTDGAPSNVEPPKDTGLTGIIGENDGDPVVYSYMGGANLDTPRALLSIITTDNGSGGTGLSTGQYWVLTPDLTTDPIGWSATGGPQGVKFIDGDGADILGNLYGIGQAGKFLFLEDYDTMNIYRIDVTDFENPGSPNYDGANHTYTVTDITDVSEDITQSLSGDPQGAALIVLTDSRVATAPVTYLYAAYNYLTPQSPSMPTAYDTAVIVRYTVNTSTGALSAPVPILSGKNLQSLVPALGGPDGITILSPCIGGPQNYGNTNGAASTLHRVPAFENFTQANSVAALTGAGTKASQPPVTVAGYYDIKSVAVSEDGLAYLLIETEDTKYNTWWKLYKTSVASILSSTGTEIPDAVSSQVLEEVDSGVGSKGYEWHLMYENATPASNGRLWFVQGTPIRVSQGSDYKTEVLFDLGVIYPGNPSDPLDAITLKNVNSADLIGEMIYQYSKGQSIDTRLIKGKSASTKTAQALAAEDKEEK
jgi:hypothetical protein